MIEPYYETELGKLYHGDCIEIMQDLEPVDLILTDPPYSSGARQTNQLRARGAMIRNGKFQKQWFGTDNCSTAGFMFLMRGCTISAFNLMKPGSHFYSFIDWRNYPILTNVLESAGVRINNMIVWDKEYFGMGTNYRQQHELVIFGSKGQSAECNRHDLPNILKSRRVKQDEHPTEKPVWLLSQMLEMSTKPGDVVLDYFFGSASLASACEKIDRRWIGIEISEEYCEIAAKRIESETRQRKLFT